MITFICMLLAQQKTIGGMREELAGVKEARALAEAQAQSRAEQIGELKVRPAPPEGGGRRGEGGRGVHPCQAAVSQACT